VDQTLATIPLTNLAIAFIPVGFVLILLTCWSLPQKRTLHALVRMLMQLLLVGYVLSYIFESHNAWVIGSLLFIMVLFSSWIALNNIESSRDITRKSLFRHAFLAISISSLVILLFITQGVLSLEPWYNPKTLVPLAGMVFANGMNSVSLCGERFFAEINRDETYLKARNIAFKASMIPNINALFAVGIVSLPGMMTGQILAGVSPFIAARYQIMVMCMVFASAGLASAIFLMLHKPKSMD